MSTKTKHIEMTKGNVNAEITQLLILMVIKDLQRSKLADEHLCKSTCAHACVRGERDNVAVIDAHTITNLRIRTDVDYNNVCVRAVGRG